MAVHAANISAIPGWERPPVLIIADTDQGARRAEAAIGEAGWRAVSIPAEGASERLALQGEASAVWLELDGEATPPTDALLRDPRLAERFPTIVATPMARLDTVLAAIGDTEAEVLVDPDAVDRVSALALSTATRGTAASVHDVSAEPSAARLRQLSDEVGRIAATLARLSTGPGSATAVEIPVPPSGDGEAAVTGEQVRAVIRARRLRARFFDGELFADPAWDMLLDLFQAEIAQHRVPVSSLCIAAAVPPTTALRWIKTMTDVGLFRRRADPHDGRRVFVELAPDASGAMRRYFAQVGTVAA